MADEATDGSLSRREQAFLDHLSKLAADPDIRIFAVMDGAFFQNVGAELRDAGLTRRALYRYGDNYAVVVGGPWLINPYRHSGAADASTQNGQQPPTGEKDEDLSDEALKAKSEAMAAAMKAALDAGDQTGGGMLPLNDVEDVAATVSRLETILRIADGKPGLVFWIGDAALTEEMLYGHLRRLNKMLVPKDQPNGEEAVGELSEAAATEDEIAAPGSGDAYELVVFRHADANVMAQVFPALNDEQAARLFGPCHQIMCAPDADWGGGIKRAQRPDELPTPPPTGPLRLEPETMRAIGERRMVPFDEKLAQALQEKYPGRTFGRSGSFMESVRHHRRQAHSRFGISVDQHFMDYLEIVFMRGELVTEENFFRRIMARPGWLMEEKCQRLRRHYLASQTRGEAGDGIQYDPFVR